MVERKTENLGVAGSIPVLSTKFKCKCILCGKSKNEIALLGAGYKGEAPMNMVTSPEPCAKCKKKYLSKGTMMVDPNTGDLIVMKDTAFNKMFNKPIPKQKIAFTDQDLLKKIRGMMK